MPWRFKTRQSGLGARLAVDALVERHPLLSSTYAAVLVETCALALARRHVSPVTVAVDLEGDSGPFQLEWPSPDDRARHSWEAARATEHGAEAVSIVFLDARLDLVVVDRALRGSHVDFYLGESGASLERAVVLEVGGTDDGSIDALLRDKLEQARRNPDRLPALASAVRFREPAMKIAKVRM